MRRIAIGLGVVIGGIVLLSWSGNALAADSTQSFQELKAELQDKGIEAKDLDAVRDPVEDMMDRGATKEQVRDRLTDLSNRGLKGEELKDSMNAMGELVKKGTPPEEAGNLVSRAVHKAQSEGLKGTALAGRVHEAVKQMQEEKKTQAAEKKHKEEMKGAAGHDTESMKAYKSRSSSMASERRGEDMGGGRGRGGR